MNSRETVPTDAVTSASYQQDNDDIWQPMNSNTIEEVDENPSTIINNKNYYFEPIDRDFSPDPTLLQRVPSHKIQRPIPISSSNLNNAIECTQSQQDGFSQTKRNSAMIINPSEMDPTTRSHGLSRSMTTDQFSNNKNMRNRLYYYPSVQDVLDALNRRASFKESFV